ncbi:isochorismatase family protein [Rhizobium sp. NFR07]|uniref:isochorismatase family protein n=1 Tax=Rhizobium sp. NFR07 TaxID=1566262 RepID=UPI000B86C9FF|nr:isochorismatase family protein [Rhizobium sp. NFR07]
MEKALIVIDMQMLIQDRLDAGRDHVNGNAAAKIADLAKKFRDAGKKVIHVHHHELNPASPMHKGCPAQQAMPALQPFADDPIFVKSTSSAFASTEMEKYLRENRIGTIVVTGAVAGYCVNTTVRAGSDLGFEMIVARDAVIGFDMPDYDLPARTIFDVTMAHLESDFARVIDSDEIMEML